MSSAAKIAANRRNAQRSTGPRSATGKARTRYNALQHRLNVPTRYDQETGEQIQELAVYLSADSFEPQEQDLAMRAAEAQFDLLRVQRAKVDLVNGAAKHLERADASLPESERVALAFMRKSKTLAAFDRYERRATSSRNCSLRKLRALQELDRRQQSVEQVGPPRPKQHRKELPFVEDVWWLQIHPVVKAAIQTGKKLPSQDGSSTFRMHLRWGPKEKPHVRMCVVDLIGDHSWFTLIDRQAAVQSFRLSRVLTRVGGGKWLVQCPESGKMVQCLYLHAKQPRFRSRHALNLRYRSKTLSGWERHWERCQKLMDRIGAANYRDRPPRPKYMRRETYQWICQEITTETIRMFRAHLGKDAP
jgi:hypothetical protein